MESVTDDGAKGEVDVGAPSPFADARLTESDARGFVRMAFAPGRPVAEWPVLADAFVDRE